MISEQVCLVDNMLDWSMILLTSSNVFPLVSGTQRYTKNTDMILMLQFNKNGPVKPRVSFANRRNVAERIKFIIQLRLVASANKRPRMSVGNISLRMIQVRGPKLMENAAMNKINKIKAIHLFVPFSGYESSDNVEFEKVRLMFIISVALSLQTTPGSSSELNVTITKDKRIMSMEMEPTFRKDLRLNLSTMVKQITVAITFETPRDIAPRSALSALSNPIAIKIFDA